MTRRPGVRVLAVLLVAGALAALLAPAGPAGAHEGHVAETPAGAWVDESVAGGLGEALSADFLPDGRALVLAKNGEIRIVDPVTFGATAWVTIPDVDDAGERGALDLEISPTFATDGLVYVYATRTPDARLRIDRLQFTGSPADLASRTTIWLQPEAETQQAWQGEYHNGGDLAFGPDGKLYLSVGDGYRPANSQSLTNSYGKVHRLNPDGSVPADNPFVDADGPNVDSIWALGLRNPFRMSWDGSGRLWIGDVGGNIAEQAYEEVNLGAAGANYGWPACEGPLGQPKNGPDCPAGTTPPVFAYEHEVEGACCFNRAITGGAVVGGPQLPAEMQGAYVYADYPTGTFGFLSLSGSAVAHQTELAQLDGRVPVWVGQGTDGHLYYVNFGFDGDGQLRRLRWSGAPGQWPSVDALAISPVTGQAPLAVTYATAVSPNGPEPVSVRWEFGDGTTSTTASGSKIYTTPGRYTARVIASVPGGGAVASAPITVQVGTVPTVAITSPAVGQSFRAGDVLTLSATGTDDGLLTYSWNVELLHDDHAHPLLTGAAGAAVALPIARTGHDYQGNTRFRVTVTATDTDGLTATASRIVVPDERLLTVVAPQGITPTVDGIPRVAPGNVVEALIGFQHVLEAPASACVGGVAYQFRSWSDGSPRVHTLTMPDAHTVRSALYDAVGSCGTPAAQEPTYAAFLDQLFLDLLGRPPIGVEREWGLALLTTGSMSRVGMVELFFASPEYEGLGPSIARLYAAYFLRSPDTTGLDYWLGQRRQGRDLAWISGYFAESPEFVGRYGTLDPVAFVELVYRNVLGREPEDEGRAFWVSQLVFGGMDRGRLMLLFSDSAEYRARQAAGVTVILAFHGLLRRAPTPAELAAWAPQLAAGLPRSALFADLLGRPEYRARFA